VGRITTDTFNRANGALGANWTEAHSVTGWTIATNQASLPSFDVGNAIFTGAGWTGGADGFSELTLVSAVADPSTVIGPTFRSSAVALTYYGFWASTSGSQSLVKSVAGVVTTLASGTFTVAAGDVLRTEVSGTTVRAVVNGVVKLTATDAAIASGNPGFYGSEGSGSVGIVVDTWSAGDFVITHKQSVSNKTPGTGTSIGVAITPNAKQNLLIVSGGTAQTTGTLSIADTAGNTWTQCNPAKTQTGSGMMRGWYALANGTSATTITVSTTASADFMNILVDEFDGTDIASPIGNHDEASAASGAPVSAAVVLDADNCAVWAASNDSITAVGNIDGSAATKGNDDGVQDWTEYRILSGRNGASVTAAFTGTSGAWIQLTTVLHPWTPVTPAAPIIGVRETHAQFPKYPMTRQ
jgi:hypothetical protein